MIDVIEPRLFQWPGGSGYDPGQFGCPFSRRPIGGLCMTTGSTRELPQITVKTDTRDILARARAYAKKHKLHDYMVVDIDAHITESAFWSEIVGYMESDVYQQMARSFQDR